MAENAAATTTEAPSQSTTETPETGTPQASPTVAEQVRELPDTDLDAVVTLKINGEPVKMKVSEAIKRAQIAEATSKKLDQAKATAREFEQAKAQMSQLAHIAKTNPRAFMEMVGVDPYSFAEATLSEKLQMMNMTPEARRAYELEQRYQNELRQKQQLEQQLRSQADAQIEAQYADQLDQEMSEAFESSGLPNLPFYVQQIAAEMLRGQTRGEPLSAKEAAGIIKDRFYSDVAPVLRGLDLNQIRDVLGSDVLKKLREDDIRRVQDQSQTVKKPQGTPAPRAKQPKVFKTDREYRDWVESLKQ